MPVRIYSPAKTVADCFKYRNKIGAEIAVEALKDYLKQHLRGADALWRFAKVCRVSERDATLSGSGGLKSRRTRDRVASVRARLLNLAAAVLETRLACVCCIEQREAWR